MDINLATVIDESELKKWTLEQWAKYYAQPKHDGARLLYMGGKFYSRSGKQLHHLEHIEEVLREIPHVDEYMLDGEVVGGSWNDTMSITRASKSERNGEALVYHLFDAVTPLSSQRIGDGLPYFTRYRVLGERLLHNLPKDGPVRLVDSYRIHDYTEFKTYFHYCLSSGCDGVVLKEINAPYEYKRTKTWLKVKPIQTFDCKIVGSFEGKGKHKGRLGGFIVKPEGSDVATKVGTGFTDAERTEWWLRKTYDYRDGRVCEVEARGVHKSGCLIEPRFVRMRPDKEEENT